MCRGAILVSFKLPLRPFVDGGPKRSLGWPGKEQSVIGQVLGHCRVVAKIGEGGMGVVYRAHDEVLHRDVALKVVNKGAGLDASASQNLLHEARASSSLAHPNICTIYEVGETEGDLYIVMELVEGKSLCAMSGGGSLPYMAPEVLRGEAADYRSDLWALGVVLYEAVSGRLPFGGCRGFEISSAIMRELPKPLGPPVPPGLWAIIQRCLTKEPTQRYQRASEVQAALEAVQSAAIVSTEPSADHSALRTTVLHSVRHHNVRKGEFLLLVGTTKGAFLLRSNARRTRWEVGGPYFHGHAVYAMAYDSRGGQHRIWASTQSYWGTMLRSSDDFGKSWTNPHEAPIRFPADTGLSLKNIWQISLGPSDQPDVLYCGVEPAALFESHDAGETWSLVRGLFDHPHRPRWMPGNGGLALHTIVFDQANTQRMYIAISAGGVYRTDDGGRTWTAQNRGVRAMFMPNKYPEFGQCVHKIAMHPARPERLYLQNHWGLYRSDDNAENWKDIANGVPSDFGFAMVIHPKNPDWVYIVPVESDQFRCACDGRLRVYRTRNAGASWEPLMRGLPQKRAYETVLRDAMTADSFDPVGIYFGTRSGQIFGSRDEGRTWQRILDGLPSVVCIRNAVVEDASGKSGPKSPKESRAISSPTKSATTRKSRPTKKG